MKVVRPSGVWNSRAPLHIFFSQTSLVQQTYGLLTSAIAKTRYEAVQLPPESSTSARRFMKKGTAGPMGAKGWIAYRDAWQRLSGKYGEQPSIQDVEHDLGTSLHAVREFAIIRYSALFESFVQCWSLNMILAKLESGAEITVKQKRIAENFSPVDKKFVLTPTVRAIFRAFPDIQEKLSNLPHISTDPATGAPVERPADPKLNALRTVLFWRDYRNHLVHSGGLISTSFSREHSEFFDLLRTPYGSKLRPLQPRSRLQLPDVMYYAIATTHNKVAIWLNSALQDISGKSRGCIRPVDSGLPEPKKFEATARPRALLLKGDHSESLAWVNSFITTPVIDDDSEVEDIESSQSSEIVP